MEVVKDNRELIKRLEEADLLKRIKKQVDPIRGEGTCLFRKSHEDRGPAVLLENIKGYEEWRQLGAFLDSFEKVALYMGMDPDSSRQEIHHEFADRRGKKMEPEVVSDGPVKENVITDPDLTELASSMVHTGDGGRYIATWHAFITKHPELDWTNWGMYRGHVLDANYMVSMIAQAQDQISIMREYEKKNEPVPICCAIGPGPSSAISATMNVGPGENESEYAGGLQGSPIELVKAETNDHLVPANAELVIEGEVIPRKRVPEGPFGEYTGYRGCPRDYRYLIKVNAITHRNDPIVTISDMGMPWDECDVLWGLSNSAVLKEKLDKAGIPVMDVHIPPEFSSYLIIVQTETTRARIASSVRNVVYSSGTAESYMHYTMVVPPDVDPFDVNEVLHAFFTRCNVNEDYLVTKRGFTSALTTMIPYAQRKANQGPKVAFDCTWDKTWDPDMDIPIKASYKNERMYPKEVQNLTEKLWEEPE